MYERKGKQEKGRKKGDPLGLYYIYSSLQNCPNVRHVETKWLVTQKVHIFRF